MKRYFKILILLIVIGLISFMGYSVVSKINHKKQIAENIKTIPSFSYQDIDGVIFTDKNLKDNTPTLFVYFNSECEFCNEEAQMIKENINKLKEVQVIFVSFQNQEEITAFAKKHQLTNYGNITFLCDSKVAFASTFDVKSLPCLVLYDKNKQLIDKLKGQTKVETILKKLQITN